MERVEKEQVARERSNGMEEAMGYQSFRVGRTRLRRLAVGGVAVAMLVTLVAAPAHAKSKTYPLSEARARLVGG